MKPSPLGGLLLQGLVLRAAELKLLSNDDSFPKLFEIGFGVVDCIKVRAVAGVHRNRGGRDVAAMERTSSASISATFSGASLFEEKIYQRRDTRRTQGSEGLEEQEREEGEEEGSERDREIENKVLKFLQN